MENIFLKESETLKKGKIGGGWNGTYMFVLICMVCLISFVSTQKVFAAGTDTKTVKLLLVDEEYGDGLSGGQFTLAEKVDGTYKDMDGKSNVTVASEGYTLGELSVGEYRLTQVQAPGGYIISSEEIEFQVTADGVVVTNDANATIETTEDGAYVITVPNAAFRVKLPRTGGTGTVPYTVGGLLLVIVSVLSVFLLQGKRDNATK